MTIKYVDLLSSMNDFKWFGQYTTMGYIQTKKSSSSAPLRLFSIAWEILKKCNALPHLLNVGRTLLKISSVRLFAATNSICQIIPQQLSSNNLLLISERATQGCQWATIEQHRKQILKERLKILISELHTRKNSFARNYILF